jgi:hypothetical protein
MPSGLKRFQKAESLHIPAGKKNLPSFADNYAHFLHNQYRSMPRSAS